MPVQKFSAMDPSGTWQMDARDQTAMWNADRGDRINMWQQNRIDQRGQDDWRRDVALQSLNLDRDKWATGRQDVKERDKAFYDWEREKFGVDKADRDVEREMRIARHNLGMDADEVALEEARDASTRRRNAANYWQTQFDPTALGVTDPKVAATLKTMAAQDPSIAQQYLASTIGRGLSKQFQPEDRADAGERARIEAATKFISGQAGQVGVTPKARAEFDRYKGILAAAGIGDTGESAPIATSASERALSLGDEAQKIAEELDNKSMFGASDSDIAMLKRRIDVLVQNAVNEGYTGKDLDDIRNALYERLAAVDSQYSGIR